MGKKALIVVLVCVSLSSQARIIEWLSKPVEMMESVANADVLFPRLSANGQYLAFRSSATNLIADDTNGLQDLFIINLLTEDVQRANLLSDGSQMTEGTIKSISNPTSDGRYIAFSSASAQLPGSTGFFADDMVYLKDLQTGALTNLSYYTPTDWFEPISMSMTDDAQTLFFTTFEEIDPLHDRDIQLYRLEMASGNITLLSRSADGLEAANENISLRGVSRSGDYVLVESEATNLTATAPLNGDENLYRFRLSTQERVFVNVTPQGDPSSAAGDITVAQVSNNGRVVFSTDQSDLVTNDNNNLQDVFIFDGQSNQRINVLSDGTEVGDEFFHVPSLAISGDGETVVFSQVNAAFWPNDNNDKSDVFVYDWSAQTTELITASMDGGTANEASFSTVLSADGQRLAFVSRATDLLPSDPIFSNDRLYVRQLNGNQLRDVTPVAFAPTTVLEDVSPSDISANQRYVIFTTKSPGFVPISDYQSGSSLYLMDRTEQSVIPVACEASDASMSASGQYIVYKSRFLSPDCEVQLLSDHVFLYDRFSGIHTQIADGFSADVNDDGVVVFTSTTSLVPEDIGIFWDVYSFDSRDQSLYLLSENDLGLSGDASSSYPTIGGSGQNIWVAFESAASDLIALDSNAQDDVFLRKWPDGNIVRVSQTTAGTGGDSDSGRARISDDATAVAFSSSAKNLTIDDYSNASFLQIFAYDRATQNIELISRNDSGLPVGGDGTDFASSPNISYSGRYVSYVYIDDGEAEQFAGDLDGRFDSILVDRQTGLKQLISQFLDGTNFDYDGISRNRLAEDLSVSPARIGVLLSAHGSLSGEPNHPGYKEAFLYQQGGPDLQLTIQVQGEGSVTGSLGINCSQNCAGQYPLGTALSLIAQPAGDAEFLGWNVDFGDCQDDTNPCELLMDRDKVLTAHFTVNDVIFANGFD